MEYKILFGLFLDHMGPYIKPYWQIAITEIATKDNGELYYKTGCGL